LALASFNIRAKASMLWCADLALTESNSKKRSDFPKRLAIEITAEM
jgi:hypothetical protein